MRDIRREHAIHGDQESTFGLVVGVADDMDVVVEWPLPGGDRHVLDADGGLRLGTIHRTDFTFAGQFTGTDEHHPTPFVLNDAVQEDGQGLVVAAPVKGLDEFVTNVFVPQMMVLQGEGGLDADGDLLASTCHQT